jgi:hypothetical protein
VSAASSLASDEGRPDADTSRDLLATGVGNLVGGLLGLLPISLSLSRSRTVAELRPSSGRLPAFSHAAVLLLLLVLLVPLQWPLLDYLPKAAIAGALIGVSIEMIEAVGERFWPVYFATIKARLAEGGRAVLQAITVPDAEFSVYRRRSDFIRQHIFPGGMLPCHAAMAHEAARAGLELQGGFSFGQDYARTCRIWLERMMGERGRIMRMGHDDRLLRGWQFYLEGCAAAFATGRSDVVQVELRHMSGSHE